VQGGLDPGAGQDPIRIGSAEPGECLLDGHLPGLELPIEALSDELRLRVLGVGSPVPRILERRQLSVGPVTRFILEDDVLAPVGAKRWVEIHEVNALVADVAPQHVEVVSLVERVQIACHRESMRGPSPPD
jgi:hypothetical protein